jgi:hypothetical protein
MINKCPYCGKNDCVRQCVWSNAEHYGSTGGTLPCIHCGRVIKVSVERKVVLKSVTKSDVKREDADW